jgi:hypothetical protein
VVLCVCPLANGRLHGLGIQQEPTPGYSPECNGIAERHNLSLLDIARPMLADSGDERLGLAPLGERFAGHAVMYANT